MAATRGSPVFTQHAEALEKVHAMLKGDGENSYSKISETRAVICKIPKLVLSEALETLTLPSKGSPVVVADLGSPDAIADVALIVDKLRLQLPKDADYQAYLNGLPSNDFNNLFQLLSGDKAAKNFFVAVVPGSYFNRLFPRSSVHVFHSSLRLHFLSKVPDVVLQKDSPAYNKGNVWIAHSRSAVAKAYQQQASLDLKAFLQARAAELVSGGLLFFQCSGRTSTEPNMLVDEPTSREFFSTDINQVWSDLVEEGLVTEEQRDTLNFPIYMRSIEELTEAIESSSSLFRVLTTKIHKIDVDPFEAFQTSDANEVYRKHAGMFKGALSTIIELHVGKEVANVLWQRYEKLLAQKKTISNFTASLGVVALIRR